MITIPRRLFLAAYLKSNHTRILLKTKNVITIVKFNLKENSKKYQINIKKEKKKRKNNKHTYQ